MMWIPRLLEPRLWRLAATRPVVQLEGLSLREIGEPLPDLSWGERLLRGGFPELYARRC